ncbi:hypothetical protein SESBI_28944 [Sesbania bispinosa]|nr:hypothetical protein SESBI_28944 [Sesbania bispinosa]
MGEMEASEEGTTTSLSKTSVEKVVMAALLDGRRVSVCGADSRFDIVVDHVDAPYAFNSPSLPARNAIQACTN